MTPRELYDSELELIQNVIGWICRRHAMRLDEAEDFESWVHVHLLENDCATLGKFQGKAKLRTYLITVVNNLFKDYLIAKNSKWRPSAKAKHLGWVAVALETELHRRGHSLEEATVFVRQSLEDHGVRMSDQQLEELAAKLPTRYRRTFTGESSLDSLDSGASSDEAAERSASEPEAERIAQAVSDALADLDPEDCLILRMRFLEGQKVVTIARVLGLDGKRLYARIETLLKKLRIDLEDRGVTVDAVARVLAWDFDLDIACEPEKQT